MNEADIIKGCIKNDRDSQKALYDLNYNKMLGICMRYSHNADEAKDILYEGFKKVFDGIKHHKNVDPIEDWIKKTVIMAAIEHLRNNKQNYLIVSTVNVNEKTIKPIPLPSDEELAELVDTKEILPAVQELSSAFRSVLNLYMIEGYTHKEIAEMLDISEETSKLNLSTAKFNLRKNLANRLKKSTVNGN